MDDDIPSHLRDNKCGYCTKDLQEEWESNWDKEHHYKIIVCECGKKNWLKVSFHGSGHDNHISGESPLESAIRKVREG
jgi:hypothetical protein